MTDKRLRLDLALIKLHPELSRRKAQDAIEKGQVSVDGRVSREPGESVTEAAEIRWDRNRKATPKTRISLPLLYADDDLVIVVDPSHPWAIAGKPRSAEELVREPLVARERDSATREVLDQALRGVGVRL